MNAIPEPTHLPRRASRAQRPLWSTRTRPRFLPSLNLKRSTLNLFLNLILAGCAVGPNYQRPAAEIPSDWRWKPAEPRDTDTKGPWWELFNDPVLSGLQNDALAGNQDLQAALARIEQARAQSRVARADLLPAINSSATWDRYRTTGSGNPSPPLNIVQPSRTLGEFGFLTDLSYEIDLWGKVRRGFESARNQALAAASAYQNVLFSLQAELARTYFDLRIADHEVDILDQTVRLREDGTRIFQVRFDSGYGSELDLSRAKTELASARADLAAAQRNRAQLQNALATLCGKPPSGFAIAPALITLDPPPIAPGLPSELLERRPDIAEAERTLAARNAEIGVATAAFFPVVRLTASGGYQSAELSDLFAWESRIWTFGPSISLPIFSGGRNLANLQSARAAYEESVALYRQSVLVAFREVDDALAGLRFLQDQNAAFNDALVSARKSAELSIARFKNGVAGYLDVIDAERSRLTTELLAVRTAGARMTTTVQLVRAIGGGWSSLPPDSPTTPRP